MRKSRRFLLGLLVLLALSLPCFAVNGDVTLTQSEFQTLKTALQMADKQLTESENEIKTLKEKLAESETLASNLKLESENLLIQLDAQSKALETLTAQLDSALKSLKTLKTETKVNNVILIIVGVAGVALGGSLAFLILGGR